MLSALGIAGVLPTAAAAHVPTIQRLKPAGLGISLTVAANWGVDNPADNGFRFQVDAPGRVAELQIATGKAIASFPAGAANVVKAERQRVLKADPKGTVTSHSLAIDSLPAVEIAERYNSLGITGPAEITAFLYLFQTNGHFYLFNYWTTADWLAREKPVFDASVSSIRFAQTA